MVMRKILIVIDMQNDFIDGSLGTKEAEAIVEAAAGRIRACREAGWKIIATLDTHGDDYLETREGRWLPVPHCIQGTEGWRVHPGLAALLEGCEDYALGLLRVFADNGVQVLLD